MPKNNLTDPKKQDRGSPEPMPGRCGSKLRNSDPPRYCMRYPSRGKKRCSRCGGKAPGGPASPKWKHGRRSKYTGVLPSTLAKHLDATPLEAVASCREEIALVDARTAEILDGVRREEPARLQVSARAALGLLSLALDDEDVDQARSSLAALEEAMSRQASITAAWSEIMALLDTRTKLAKTEIAYQKLMSERVMAEHLDAFIRALITEARALTDDRQRLNLYVMRVLEVGRSVVGQALLPASSDVIDVKPVESEG